MRGARPKCLNRAPCPDACCLVGRHTQHLVVAATVGGNWVGPCVAHGKGQVAVIMAPCISSSTDAAAFNRLSHGGLLGRVHIAQSVTRCGDLVLSTRLELFARMRA